MACPRMPQSRIASFLEATANTAVGLGVSWLANLIVLPAFGYQVTAGDALAIGVVFTGISLGRSYILRRIFNRR